MPEQAKVVRRVLASFLKLRSYKGAARALSRAGIPSPGGGRWHDNVVKGILQNPTCARVKVCGRSRKRDTRLWEERRWAVMDAKRKVIIPKRLFVTVWDGADHAGRYDVASVRRGR